MNKDQKMDLTNPFAGFNASLMNDDEIMKYWVKPQILFEQQAIGVDLTGNIPVILMGGRGTGKTTLLKFMSNEVQVKKYLSEHKDGRNFFKDTPYIGVYYRFDGPSLSSFTDRHAEEVVWETLFKHYFEIVIGQKYVAMLLNLKKNKCLNFNSDSEKNIVYKAMMFIDTDYPLKEEICTLENFSKILQSMADKIFQFINEAPLQKEPEFRSRPIIPPGKLIFGMAELFIEEIPEFQRKNIVILLDEYENLLLQQQKIVNTLIKHVKQPVTFRIGARINGFKTYDTLNEGELLMEDADYRKILFEDILLSHTENYKNLLKEIARKRLESINMFKENNLTDIEEWLGNFDPVNEALEVVSGRKVQNHHINEYKNQKHIQEIIKELKKRNISDVEIDKLLPQLIYPKNTLMEMLNLLLLRRGYSPKEIINLFNLYIARKKNAPEFKIYKDLYEKNKLALLFQLISLYRPKKKMYAGFDVFSMLTSGIIRNFLELCYQCFNIALFYEGEELLKKRRISQKYQTEGAETRSEKFYNVIDIIPKYGNNIKSLVGSLGAVFSTCHMDSRLREPEVTYFCVDKSLLSEDVREIFNTAVKWSVLQQKKPMKSKSPTEPLLDVYALNHILAPYFCISYRLRGRIPAFSKRDIETLIFGDYDKKRNTIRRLGRWLDFDKKQLTLFDFNRGGKR